MKGYVNVDTILVSAFTTSLVVFAWAFMHVGNNFLRWYKEKRDADEKAYKEKVRKEIESEARVSKEASP